MLTGLLWMTKMATLLLWELDLVFLWNIEGPPKHTIVLVSMLVTRLGRESGSMTRAKAWLGYDLMISTMTVVRVSGGSGGQGLGVA